MRLAEFQSYPLGLYHVYWSDGDGSSLASIGQDAHGNLWLAPINWIAPLMPDSPNYVEHICGIKRLERIAERRGTIAIVETESGGGGPAGSSGSGANGSHGCAGGGPSNIGGGGGAPSVFADAGQHMVDTAAAHRAEIAALTKKLQEAEWRLAELDR